MIAFLLVATAIAAPVATQQPYYMEKASSAMVKYAVKYRKTDVPESQASAAAQELVSSALAQPQATELVKSAVSYYAANGPQVTGRQAEELVSRASSYYDEIRTKPAYVNYAKLVQQKQPLFDINKAVDDAQSKVISLGSGQSEKAQKIANKAVSAYQTLESDPAGAKAIQEGKQLASRVAQDFHVDIEKVKSKASLVKASISNMIFRR